VDHSELIKTRVKLKKDFHPKLNLFTMKFCWSGTQLYMVGIGLTALMILMGIDWILPSMSFASARRMN
jgi:hypothetical protein